MEDKIILVKKSDFSKVEFKLDINYKMNKLLSI